MRIEESRALAWHAHLLAPRLRQSDKDEISVSGGLTPLAALLLSVRVSDPELCWTALFNGRPEAMCGVAPFGNAAVIWMLSSDEVYRHRRWFWRESKNRMQMILKKYPAVANLVDPRNTTTRAWLKRLGFKEHPPVPAGVGGYMLIPITRTA